MIRAVSIFTVMLVSSLVVLSGCVTPLPPTYQADTGDSVLDGNVLALAGDGGTVAAANSDGLFLKKNGGPWEKMETPGISNPGSVTCLGVNGDEIAVGTDGEGLHLFSGSAWEVRTSRYGGLPDDGVLSLAYDGNDEGLAGSTLWVGTRKGIAARRDGQWKVYSPETEWLMDLTGGSGTGAGKVYVGAGFKLGRKGDDVKTFRPPVYAIGVGPHSLVLGNKDSGIAIVTPDVLSIMKLLNDYKITSLWVKENVIWAGTDRGLVWGGLKGGAVGKPWPTTRGYLDWSATLIGSRNTQPFEYRWKLLGYNSAEIVGLVERGPGLWVAYRAESQTRGSQATFSTDITETDGESQRSAIRLYVSIDEYVARNEAPQYENYGSKDGIKGKPTALYVPLDSSNVWVGTDKGLWELKQ